MAGRSKVRKDPARWLTIYFPDPDLRVRLERVAKRRGMPVSTLCRQILEGEIGGY